jgi:hypothetical protein
VATEAVNTFEDAMIETEAPVFSNSSGLVASNRAPIVDVGGEDAAKRHAILLGIFSKLRTVELKESLVQATSNPSASMLLDHPQVKDVTVNAFTAGHPLPRKGKGRQVPALLSGAGSADFTPLPGAKPPSWAHTDAGEDEANRSLVLNRTEAAVTINVPEADAHRYPVVVDRGSSEPTTCPDTEGIVCHHHSDPLSKPKSVHRDGEDEDVHMHLNEFIVMFAEVILIY